MSSADAEPAAGGSASSGRDGTIAKAVKARFRDEAERIIGELSRSLAQTSAEDVRLLAQDILTARRIFAVAAGRSRLALSAGVMRLMHFGCTAHIAGDVTTPAIASGDLLIAASNSGHTSGVLESSKVARQVGARLVAITSDGTSPLAQAADHVIVLAAAGDGERPEDGSHQFMGSRFEQSLFLLMDIVFHALWQASGQSAESMSRRHANLE
jgi:6-phospho-3-hexuloisomerase